MRGLSAAALLEVWESGADQARPERARLLLRSAELEWPDEEMDSIGLGERDAWLLEVRRKTFGEDVRALVTCPMCGEQLELTKTIDDLVFEPPADRLLGARPVELSLGDLEISARTVDAADLHAAAECDDVDSARLVLLGRCVVRVVDGGVPVPVEELAEDVVARIGDAIEHEDPQAEIRLQLRCANCDHGWDAIFDTTFFLWREVNAAGERLVDEVNTLAEAYGWTEGEILSLSSWRRRTYLDRAVNG